MQNFTLHTHTNLIDGWNTAEEMIVAAKEKGFKTFGISEHFVVHPNLENTLYHKDVVARGYRAIVSFKFKDRVKLFQQHFENIDKIADKHRDIQILKGFEVDYFKDTAWEKDFEKAMSILKPDYLIGASHFVEVGRETVGFNALSKQNQDNDFLNAAISRYWDKEEDLVNSGYFNFLAHLDLPKKHGLGEEAEFDDKKTKILEVIAANNMPVEINTRGFRELKEPYPGVKLLEQMNAKSIPVFLSDDSHMVKQIGGYFAEGEALLNSLGYKNRINPVNPNQGFGLRTVLSR